MCLGWLWFWILWSGCCWCKVTLMWCVVILHCLRLLVGRSEFIVMENSGEQRGLGISFKDTRAWQMQDIKLKSYRYHFLFVAPYGNLEAKIITKIFSQMGKEALGSTSVTVQIVAQKVHVTFQPKAVPLLSLSHRTKNMLEIITWMVFVCEAWAKLVWWTLAGS